MDVESGHRGLLRLRRAGGADRSCDETNANNSSDQCGKYSRKLHEISPFISLEPCIFGAIAPRRMTTAAEFYKRGLNPGARAKGLTKQSTKSMADLTVS